MFIYADESGHTGRKIFDAPATYRVGAILSSNDCEEALSKVIGPELEKLGQKRLHANELGVPKVLDVLPRIFKELNEAGTWMFLHGSIEKDYISSTKFVDLIFDSGENLAAPQLWYNLGGFRHTLCLKVDGALREKGRLAFWSAYLSDDVAAIQSTVRSVHQFIRMRETDARIREVMKGALEYALRHPEDFTLMAAKGKRAYQGHTPNMIAFSFIFEAIHKFADETGGKPMAFIHDRQTEFGTSMKEWAELFGSVKHKNEKGFATMSIADYALPKLMLPSSKDVFSLQAVDLILWAMSRNEKEFEPILKGVEHIVHMYEISRRMSAQICAELVSQFNDPVSDEQWEAGRKLRDEWETKRVEMVRSRRFGSSDQVGDA